MAYVKRNENGLIVSAYATPQYQRLEDKKPGQDLELIPLEQVADNDPELLDFINKTGAYAVDRGPTMQEQLSALWSYVEALEKGDPVPQSAKDTLSRARGA